MKKIIIDNKEIEISDESFESFKKQFEIEDNKRWKPEYNEQYYSIMDTQYPVDFNFQNDNYDNTQYKTKNMYKTREECQRALEIKNILINNTYDFTLKELQDSNISKYVIGVDYNSKTLNIWDFNVYDTSTRYFKNREIVEKLIDFIGYDDYVKYCIMGGIK